MKITKLILFTVIISSLGFSQSKEETIDWIHQNINNFPVVYKSPSAVVSEIYIENGYLYHFECWRNFDYGGDCYNGYWNRVALKEIKSIKYTNVTAASQNNFWFRITFKSKPDKHYRAKLDEGFVNKENASFTVSPYGDSFDTRFNMNYVESGMKKRMEKALLHIIKLYGGDAYVKKEPF